MKRRLALAAASLAIIAGCTHVTGAPSQTLHAWTTTGFLRVGEYEEPDSLSPIVSQEAVTTDAVNLIYDGLIRYDAHGEPVPDLATAVPSRANGGISKDGLTITYHLRRGRCSSAPAAIPPAGQNSSWYVDRRIGAWGNEAIATYDRARRRELYAREQEQLVRDLPFYTLVWVPEIDAANADLHGLRPVPVGSDFFNVADWRLAGR